MVFLGALSLVSCGNSPGPSPAEMELVTSAAGMLARNLAYLPDAPGWSQPPDEQMMANLETMAKRNIEIWPVFFRAAADTAAKLEQLNIQQLQEDRQSEIL